MLVYLDNAATTPVDPLVEEEMVPYLGLNYGNPATPYPLGGTSAEAILVARERVSNLLKCEPPEIYFTSGGTESDNWALVGTALQNHEKKHIISSVIEHHAITNTLEFLKKHFGVDYTLLQVNQDGIVDPEELRTLLKQYPETCLVSIMHANNEIGTFQPIKELVEIAHENGALFHTDAVQTVGKIDLNVKNLGVDMLSLSAHKFYGPKGVGALYVKEGVEIETMINGGGQENGKRAGTSNVPGIVGLGKAAEILFNNNELGNLSWKSSCLKRVFLEDLKSKIPSLRLNGSERDRIHCNLNVCIPGIVAAEVVEELGKKGICAASGSACNCDSPEPSHVLMALGMSQEDALASLRFTMGKHTTREETNYTVEVLSEIVQRYISSP